MNPTIARYILIDEINSRCLQQELSVRRRLRDISNPLELRQPIFHQHYRVSKEGFRYLLDMLETALPRAKKIFAVPPVVKLSACLRFFAEGGYQKGVGKDHEVGLAQPTFCRILGEVLEILETKLCPQWIKWMTAEEKREIALNFYNKFNLPGIIGCIDGTHINIVAPAVRAHSFYNRKGLFSLNVMLICDDKMRIRLLDASHPGATHDALIWNTSNVKAHMEAEYAVGNTNSWLLGDSGYPLAPWLLTPYRTTESGSAEAKFNDMHAKCRNIIERTNGVLKNRWRCLLGARQLHYNPRKAAQIVNVCAALHNLCIHHNVAEPPEPATGDESEYEVCNNEQLNCTLAAAAQRIRTYIANSL